MRIPLDYYRILGVPIQATDGQLSQAYQDRTMQMPRREYSDLAISARKQLLDEAYGVLSNKDKRSGYDSEFIAKTYEIESQSQITQPPTQEGELSERKNDSATPWIEINQEQFAGALLILQELGEYELVLKLGHSYLNNQQSINVEQEDLVHLQMMRADIVLTLALSCLELGREQWQQGQYESASASGQMGQEMLLREGIFPSVRGEIQTDLYKLRPYCILELLALSEEHISERRKGLQLLKEMLQERGGIDGTGDDQSGLSIDDFLRFIQQLRNYLTATEQQDLFEVEARRPSAVATYLAVYALLARGFAQRQPSLIARAKEKLMRLGKRQDVHLEQAVCALLLGQTEEASRALELSQEYEPLAFIRENSQDSPDLLPGLCLYGEHWLQTDVFSHFRDLLRQQASLKEYFADAQVQDYLEQLPVENKSQNQWSVIESEKVRGGRESLRNRESALTRSQYSSKQNLVKTADTKTAALTSSNVSSPNEVQGNSPSSSNLRNSQRKRRFRGQNVPSPIYRYKKTTKQSKLLRLLLLGFLGIGLIALFILGFRWLQKTLASFSTPGLKGEQLEIDLDALPITIPTVSSNNQETTTSAENLTKQNAEQLIRSWLEKKSQALGSDHQIEQLNTVLAEPLLSKWRNIAATVKQSNSYREYKHSVTVESVKPSSQNQVKVEAAVIENSQYYKNGQLDQANSQTDNLQIHYHLVKQNDKWLIKDIKVL